MPSLISKIIRAVICIAMLIGLPLIGVAAKKASILPYLEFPPLTRYVVHAPFDAIAFVVICLQDMAMISGIIFLFKQSKTRSYPPRPLRRRAFPAWGWWGLWIMLTGWLLAWTRFSWFASLQGHTFCIPWLGYILSVNALCLQRSGSSLMTEFPKRFLILFPASAVFWWFFEYLNRFVQNWYYVEVEDFGPAGYMLLASISFSTVLPAVLSTHRLLLTFPMLDPGLAAVRPIPLPRGKLPAAVCFSVTAAGLALIGVYPDYLYPLVWVAPLLIITSLAALGGQPTLFAELRSGDWRAIVSSAVAALICGFFWELWNYYSLTRWAYAIPFVDRFHLFAMPLLGYGGYLPFGLECLVIGQIVIGKAPLAPGRVAVQ